MKKHSIFKTLLVICSIVSVTLSHTPVFAASFTASASVQEVKPGGTFTIRIGGSCIGRVNLTATNGAVSQSAIWVEENYQSVTVTAGTSGTVTVTATPEAGFSDPDANEYKPGSRSVSVKIVAPVKPPATEDKPNQPTTKPTQPNNNNKPNQNQNNQTINPQPTDTPTDQPNDSNSENKEDESKPTPVQVKYNGHNLAVISSLKDVQLPNGFQLNTYILDGQTFNIAERDNLTLIYAIDQNEQKAFYVLDRTTGSCTAKLIPFNIEGKQLFLISSDNDISNNIYTIVDGAIIPYNTVSEVSKTVTASNDFTWIIIFALSGIIIILGGCLIYITRPNKTTQISQPADTVTPKTKAAVTPKSKSTTKTNSTNHEKHS
jgi:hypothetical protein